MAIELKMKVGDLVQHIDEDAYDTIGIILRIIDDVEIPPLVEILWNTTFVISKVYPDDLIFISSE